MGAKIRCAGHITNRWIDMLAARTVLMSLLLLDIYMGTMTLADGDPAQADNDSQIVSDTLMKRTGDSPHHGTGTGCVVKGSYCQCHYCKCEKGQLHCSKKGFGGFGHKGVGKRYCYGSMEGEYCHCDYCRCKHGYGLSTHPSGHVCTY